MSIDSLLSAIDAGIARLQQVRALLSGESTTRRKSGPPSKKRGGKRTISPEGKARIAESARRRWAAAKKAGRTTLG